MNEKPKELPCPCHSGPDCSICGGSNALPVSDVEALGQRQDGATEGIVYAERPPTPILERKCGTCGYWQPREDDPQRGECGWFDAAQTPYCLSFRPGFTYAYEGAGCQTWKPK